jgi:hypothetical protein
LPVAQQPTIGARFSSAMEQWHHDIDKLIITAINTPHHEGGQ